MTRSEVQIPHRPPLCGVFFVFLLKAPTWCLSVFRAEGSYVVYFCYQNIGILIYMHVHEQYFELAQQTAQLATCNRASCGSVIVSNEGQVIGRGYNAPPLGDESQRMCDVHLDKYIKQNNDKTCCVHAEWNAIFDALKNHPAKVAGSTLYFMRVDENGGYTEAGDPYCTVCSRLALESGIDAFGLWNNGPQIIDTGTYNRKSYAFYK
jgi:deoxycytidylate deaminase